MKKYIYPKGITGELLGKMVEYVYGCEVCFIDDSSYNTSIEALRYEILSNNACVLVAWDKRSGLNDDTVKVLISKLKSFGINYDSDCYLNISKMVAKKLRQQIKSSGFEKPVAIELSGLANDKHIGYLDDYLISLNMEVVYLCGTVLAYDRVSKKIESDNLQSKTICVCMPCYYLDLIDCVKCINKVSWTNKNTSIPTICIGHSLGNFSTQNINEYFQYFDYLCVASSKYLPNDYNLSSVGGDNNVISLLSGYLGFDRVINEIYGTNILYKIDNKNSVLFAPYNKYELEKFIPLIEAILPYFKVIVRSRLVCERGFWSDINTIFCNNDNFTIDDSWEISKDTYIKSFAMVCGATTSKNTFPLISGSPCVVFGDYFIDDRLGVNLHEAKYFLEIINNIYYSKHDWAKKITEFKDEEIVNFGSASKFVANFIDANIMQTVDT